MTPVFRDHLVACSVAANDEWVSPLTRPADIDAIGRVLSADLIDIEDFAHGLPHFLDESLKGNVERPLELSFFGEGPCELGLHRCALAAGEAAAPQLGP